MIVVDASWVIALHDPTNSHHSKAVQANEAIGDSRVVIAALTLAEYLVGPAKLGVEDKAMIQAQSAFAIAQPDAGAPLRWARLRATSGLKLPDVIVLDTAIELKAEAIATFDQHLASQTIAHKMKAIGISPPPE